MLKHKYLLSLLTGFSLANSNVLIIRSTYNKPKAIFSLLVDLPVILIHIKKITFQSNKKLKQFLDIYIELTNIYQKARVIFVLTGTPITDKCKQILNFSRHLDVCVRGLLVVTHV